MWGKQNQGETTMLGDEKWTEIIRDTMAAIESNMRLADERGKDFRFSKETGQWFWIDRDDDLEYGHGPFDAFLSAVGDAILPENTRP